MAEQGRNKVKKGSKFNFRILPRNQADESFAEEKEKLDSIIDNFCREIRTNQSENLVSQQDGYMAPEYDDYDYQPKTTESSKIDKMDSKISDLIIFRLNEIEKKNMLLEKEIDSLRKDNKKLRTEQKVMMNFCLERVGYAKKQINNFKDELKNIFKSWSKSINRTQERQIKTMRSFESVKKSQDNYLTKQHLKEINNRQRAYLTKQEFEGIIKLYREFNAKQESNLIDYKRRQDIAKKDMDKLRQNVRNLRNEISKYMRSDSTYIPETDLAEWSKMVKEIDGNNL